MKRFLIAMVLAAIAVEPVFAQGLRNNLLNRRNRLQRNAPAAKQEAQPQMTREDLKSVQRGTNGVPALAQYFQHSLIIYYLLFL